MFRLSQRGYVCVRMEDGTAEMGLHWWMGRKMMTCMSNR